MSTGVHQQSHTLAVLVGGVYVYLFTAVATQQSRLYPARYHTSSITGYCCCVKGVVAFIYVSAQQKRSWALVSQLLLQ